MNRWLVAAALLLSLVARAGNNGPGGVGESIAAVDPVILGHDLEFVGYARPASRGGTPPPYPLNDSGQAACYDNDHAATPCDPVGFPGQDGRFGRDAAVDDGVLTKEGAGDAGFDFTKLSENGDELAPDAPEWACVRDNVTGLTWAVETQSSNWEDAMTTLPGDADDQMLCGLEGWRLPAPAELFGIVHLGAAASPLIDPDYFPNTPTAQHWTAAEAAHNTDRAWVIHFNNGGMANTSKTFTRDARLVHGQAVSGEYVDHGDGTATSDDTGLMWSRCALGQSWNGTTCDGQPQVLRWVEALQAVALANGAEHLGYGDWRLPNIKELISIVDYTQPAPAVDPVVFPNSPGGRFASSSSGAPNAFAFYLIQAQLHGQVSSLNKAGSAGTLGPYVRLVRAGAPSGDYDRVAAAGPGPEIGVSPPALEYELEESDGGETLALTIANTGADDLAWNLLVPELDGCYQPGDADWLSVSADAGVITSGDDQILDVSVSVDGLEPGIFETVLCFHNNDAAAPRVDVPVTLTLNEDPLPEQPVMEVEPLAFSAVVFAGETAQRALTISNLGAEILDWSAGFSETCDSTPPPWLAVTPESGSVDSLAQATVAVTLDAADLGAGDFAAVMCIEGNDPDNPSVSINIDMSVVVQSIAAPLNDSGQATCYDGGHLPAPCDPPDLPGQDGRFGRDAAAEHGVLPKTGAGVAGFDFTKLSGSGDELPADAPDWACIRDNTTGLAWAADTDEADWEDAMTVLPGAANGNALCGFEDWRLPAPHELLGIVHFDVFSPAVDTDFFPATPAAEHWTGTETPNNAARAFTVDFDFGAMNNLRDKGTLQAVRLVRGESASGAYVDHGDGTVTSADTGLMWSRCSFGQHWDGETCAGDAVTMQQWGDLLLAVAAANDTEFLGYSDWRMPGIKELTSITDHTQTLPAVDPDIFPNTPAFNNFAAATTNRDNMSQSWVVQGTGVVRALAKGTSFKGVRLVRAGAPFDDYDRLAPGGAPEIQVSPAALDFELDFDVGGSAAEFLSITNAGDADLEWNMLEPAVAGCFNPGEVGWLSAAPDAGSLAPAGEQSVAVTADADGLPPGTYQTTLCVHSNDAGNPRIDVPVTLVVVGDPLPEHPVIDVDPESISEVVFAGETAESTFTIGNLGGETLTWTVGFFGTAGLLGSEVLWDQPAAGSGSIASDYFIAHPDGDAGIYSADDFLIGLGRQITEIVTPGAWGSQFPNGTVADADAITWRIYADDGGVPAGQPEDGGNNHLWSLTLAPDHPAITIDDEDITLDVAAAEGAGIELDAGRYWLAVTPEIDYQTSIANRWNWRQGVPEESAGRMIDPQDLFNLGATDWSPFQDAGLSWTDVAFTLYGTEVELECDATPPDWLAVTPISGNTPPLVADMVSVTLDASDLPAGDYEAVLCVESDDPDNPMRLVTVNLSVVLPPTDQPLNDTGQRLCFGTDNITAPCDPNGYPGQDGRYGRDAAADDGVLPKIGAGVEGFDFTKISNSGDPLPDDAQLGDDPGDWACTRDNTTGLIWAVETIASSWDDAVDTHIPDTNAAMLCGFTDWRLPGAVELQSLVHYGLAQAMIDGDYFPHTNQGPGPFVNTYFAAEAPCQASFNRRTVDFNSGTVGCLISSAERRVQLVRGNPVEGEFVVNDDHTVTDTRTQLVWDRCSLGQEWDGGTCSGAIDAMTWQDALQAVAAANANEHLGHGDWRLPNNKELPSQCDLARSNPAVDPNVFPGTASDLYWTSTTSIGTLFDKSVVDFSICRMRGNVDGGELHHVRMVRGGNTFDRYDRLGEPPPDHPVITLDPDSVAVSVEEGGSLDQSLAVGNAGGETLAWDFATGTGCELPDDVDWLTAVPVSGDVSVGGEMIVTLSFAAGDLSPGEYGALLCIASNDPDNALAELPVEMTVSGTPEPATVEGTVEGLGYCDASPAVLEGAEVTIEGTGGAEVLSTDGNGFYQTTMNPQEGPVDITVTADGHQPETVAGVVLTPGETVVRDFGLRALLGCTEAEQDALETVLATGDSTTLALTLHNGGLLDAGFSISSDAEWLDFDPTSGTVDAEGSAGIDVMFNAPDDPGTYTAEIEITVDDGAGAFVIEVPATMTVEDAGAPEIAVDPDSVSAIVVSGETAQHDITIANTGDRALDWTFGGGGYGNLVRGGDHVTVSHSASLEMVESNAVACSPDGGFTTSTNRFMRVFDLADFGFQNAFDITRVTFGLERLNVTADVSVHLYTMDGTFANLTPVGSETVTLEPQTGALIDVPVTAALPADAVLVVEVEPQELSGIGHFYPGSNSAGESAPSYLSAPVCGAAEPAVIEDPHVHLVMTVSGQTIGGLPLECERPDDVEWLAANPTAGTVAPGDAQGMTLTFDAGDLAEGDYQAQLCLVSNDPENPVVSLPVAMTVEAAPDPGELQVSPGALDFGPVEIGATAQQSFEVANAAAPGAMPLVLDTLAVTGDPAFSIGGDCQAGTELQPQESCTVNVTFSPASEDAFAGVVEIVTADAQSGTVTLDGLGEDTEPPGDEIFTDRFQPHAP